jgi:hypothetical protein
LCTYTAGELERLARELSDERCQWWVRELPVPGAPIPVLSLIGAPIATTIGAMPGDIVAHPSVDFTWRAFSQQLLSSCTRTRWGCSPGMLVTNDPWLIQQRRDR